MSDLDEAIRERAYHLWIADGQPEGQADIYWLSAQRELLAISVESPVRHAAAPIDAAAATKPAKKARVARSRKDKSHVA